MRKILGTAGLAALAITLSACAGSGITSGSAGNVPAAASSFNSAHPSAAAVESAAAQALKNPTIAATVVKAKECAGLPANLHNLTVSEATAAFHKLHGKDNRDKVYTCAGVNDPVVRHQVENCLGSKLYPDQAWTVAGAIKIMDVELPVCLQQAGVGGATPSPTASATGNNSPPASPATTTPAATATATS